MDERTLRDGRGALPARARVALLGLLVALGSACTPDPLLTRAIRARGGPLHGIVRQAEAEVHADFAAGTWQWRTAYLAPDRYAWTIYTSHGPDHYVFDGRGVRAFIGDHQVAGGGEQGAPLRTHARFTAVANLDVLLLPGAHVSPLPADALPAGVTTGLVATLDDGVEYRLGFDESALLVWVAGPLDLIPLGHGALVARYSDFRRVRGLLLPFHTAYAFDGVPLADEQTRAACPNDPGLMPAAFDVPARLPECAP